MRRVILVRWKLFKHDTAGAAAIEFAIVIVPFMAIIGFLLQMTVVFFWTQMIEVSTMQGSRAIRSGAVQAAGMTANQFKTQMICSRMFGASCDNVVIQVRRVEKTWSASRNSGTYSFIDMAAMRLKPPPLSQGSALFCPGGPGELIVVDAVYKLPIAFTWVWPDSATMQMDGVPTAVLRWTSMSMNEPFNTAAGASC